MSSSVAETIDVDAPVAVSWALWSDVTQWPRFLSHVQNVTRIDRLSFSWWLSLPGADKSFTAELTEVVPHERIAWRTVDGVEHAGAVIFHRLEPAGTRVSLRIDYHPRGFVEHLGSVTGLDSVLAHQDLAEFKRAAEELALTEGG